MRKFSKTRFWCHILLYPSDSLPRWFLLIFNPRQVAAPTSETSFMQPCLPRDFNCANTTAVDGRRRAGVKGSQKVNCLPDWRVCTQKYVHMKFNLLQPQERICPRICTKTYTNAETSTRLVVSRRSYEKLCPDRSYGCEVCTWPYKHTHTRTVVCVFPVWQVGFMNGIFFY